MPTVQKLNFDTELFGYEVASCALTEECNEIPGEIAQINAKLTYLISNSELNIGLPCIDEKTFLGRPVSAAELLPCEAVLLEETETETYNQLLNLAYQSGIYSRFKTDTGFQNHEFEKLYKIWLDKSISGDAADAIYVIERGNRKVGFITLQKKDGAVDIGLIAVDENYRGESLGGKLIQAGINWTLNQQFNRITVTTQKQNAAAMNFYHKNGFEVIRTQYIYHIWRV